MGNRYEMILWSKNDDRGISIVLKQFRDIITKNLWDSLINEYSPKFDFPFRITFQEISDPKSEGKSLPEIIYDFGNEKIERFRLFQKNYFHNI
jgi:hypothetical protein